MNEHDEKMDKNGCPTVGYQDVNVMVPVAVKPYANVYPPRIKCCGAAVVTTSNHEYRDRCDTVCCFTISQKIKVEIPVVFGAKAEIGEPTAECDGAGIDNKPGCNSCK